MPVHLIPSNQNSIYSSLFSRQFLNCSVAIAHFSLVLNAHDQNYTDQVCAGWYALATIRAFGWWSGGVAMSLVKINLELASMSNRTIESSIDDDTVISNLKSHIDEDGIATWMQHFKRNANINVRIRIISIDSRRTHKQQLHQMGWTSLTKYKISDTKNEKQKIPHTHKMPKCRIEIARHDIEYVLATLYTFLTGIVATAAAVVSHWRNIIIICVLFVTWKFSMPWSFNRIATHCVYLYTRVLDLPTFFSKHTYTHTQTAAPQYYITQWQ